MNVSVFGLGYVGCVTAACLAEDGHQVVGVDINPKKVELICAGHSPIVEPGLDDLIAKMVAAGRLRATVDSQAALQQSEITLICVGTPSQRNGNLDLSHVAQVCREIGTALAGKPGYQTVVVRSTVLPGTVGSTLLPILERAADKRAGVGFGLCMNPEFLREGSALHDYHHPPFIVIGSGDSDDDRENRAGENVAKLFAAVSAPVIHTTIKGAEMVKYASNAFHAVKVVFANEIGNLCKAQGIDGQEVMEIFCQDRQLNISTTYLRPGFAFGGSCLPKDLRALLYRAKERDVSAPLLHAALTSNEQHVQRGIELVEQTGSKQIGVLGLSFKAGTDDVRESPVVPLIETLVGRGYQVYVYDEEVELSRLMGGNKSYLDEQIPHIASLMQPSLDALLARAEVIVVTNGSEHFQQVPHRLKPSQTLIDLVGVGRRARHHPGEIQGAYNGICW